MSEFSDSKSRSDAEVVDDLARARTAGHEDWLHGHEAWLHSHEFGLEEVKRRSTRNDVKMRYQIGALQQQIDLLMEALGTIGRPAAHDEALIRLRAYQDEMEKMNRRQPGEIGPCSGIRIHHGVRPIVVIVFGGLNDIFNLMSRLIGYGVSVIYLADSSERWYLDGCDGVSGTSEMVGHVRKILRQMPCEKVLVMGQSMGGYAALRFGPEVRADMIMAWSPQTHFISSPVIAGHQRKNPPADIQDVRPLIKGKRTRIEIFVSESENNNPPENYFWDDYSQLNGLWGDPNINIHKVACHEHSTINFVTTAGNLDKVFESMFAMLYGRPPLMDLDDLLRPAA